MLHLCAIINQPFLEQEIHTEYHTWHTYGFFCLEHLNNVEGKLSLSMCYLLNANSSCFPAAAQAGPRTTQGVAGYRGLPLPALSQKDVLWEYPFKQLLGEVLICPRYFQNLFSCLYKHESAHIQKLGKYTTCQAQTLITSDRSPFEV